MAITVFVGIAFTVFLLDVAMKLAIDQKLEKGEEREIKGTDGKLVLRKVFNEGFFMGLLSGGHRYVKKAAEYLGIVTLVGNLLYLKVEGRNIRKLGMMLCTGGIGSNVAERITRGRVTDYIGLRSGETVFTTITWNLADMAIVVGGVLTALSDIVWYLFGRKEKAKVKAAAASQGITLAKGAAKSVSVIRKK